MTRRLRGLGELALLCLALSTAIHALGCQDGRRAPDEEDRRRKQAAAQNRCESDEDCFISGCRGTLCRAAQDDRSCLHRLVLSTLTPTLEPQTIETARAFVAGFLTDKEEETLTVAPSGDGRLLVSFHASLANRDAVQSALESLTSGGIYGTHPLSDQVAGKVARSAPGLSLRRAEGGPLLVERVIHAGDVMSREDVQRAISELRAAVRPLTPEGARFAFEPILAAEPPVVRAWLVSTTKAVDFRELSDVADRLEDGGRTVVVEARVEGAALAALEGLTTYQLGRPVVLLVGEAALAAPLVKRTVDDGRFLLRLNSGTADLTVAGRMRRIREAPALAQSVAFDPSATRDAERDLECMQAEPALTTCGCVEGACAWRETEALRACLQSP